jgi:nucleolar protein 15
MGKKVQEDEKETLVHKNTKATRFDNFDEPIADNKKTWPSDAVVYIGHLPHGFYEDELKKYFGQYGEVLAVKVARSKKTARSRGYAFIQFKYAEVAEIVSQTMNGYLLLGKVLASNVLAPTEKNPFSFPTSKKYKFINWKRIYMHNKNRVNLMIFRQKLKIKS